MFPISAHKCAGVALIVMAGIALDVVWGRPAMAASTCSSPGSVSERQRKTLEQLPLGLQAVLKAVRRQKLTACLAPASLNEASGAIDPLSVPLNLIAAGSVPSEPAVPDEVVALITGDGANIGAIARANGLVVRSRQRSSLLGGFIVRFGIEDGRSVAAVTTILQSRGDVETPGPNHLYQLQDSAFEDARFAPKKIGLPSKHFDLSGKNILIGVIDTAIDPDHPDLKGAVLASFDALPDQPVSNRRHGTAVAGLIAGRSMIKGVAPKARLLVARAFDDNQGSSGTAKASATSFQLLSSLDWMVGKGARIINMSFTGPRNILMAKALARAAAKDIVLIAAAGNNGPQAPFAYPAAEQSVLAVTATDIENRIYSHANIGAYVFVAAPGVDVLAAAPDNGIDMVSGTSFAAPFLSGLAALMLEQNGDMTPRQFAKRIARSASDLGQQGRDKIFGVGLANTGLALAQGRAP